MVPISEIQSFLDFRKLSMQISVAFVLVLKVTEFLVQWKALLAKMLFHSPLQISGNANRNLRLS